MKARVRLSINIDKNIKDDFIRIAKENNTDANKLVRSYIYKYIIKHKKENNEKNSN